MFQLQNERVGPERHSPDNPLFNPPYPTLSELINFIKRTRVANGHWNPAWSWCNMCTNKFDYVIKLEEEPMELWFLLEQLGLWKDRALFLAHSNTSNSTAKINSELNLLTACFMMYPHGRFHSLSISRLQSWVAGILMMIYSEIGLRIRSFPPAKLLVVRAIMLICFPGMNITLQERCTVSRTKGFEQKSFKNR